ncbi:MAG: RHS repeat-associated core domain-containing protein [Rhodocyclaceae bacterium]
MNKHRQSLSPLALAAGLLATGPLFAQSPVTTYEYDAGGNRSKVTAPLNRITLMSYDALNRLAQTTDPAGSIVRYGYDALDRLVSVTDPRNLVTGYQYNGLGDLVAQTSPDTGTTQHTFDAAGNLLTRTDAKGQTTGYQYDAANRLTRIQYSDGQITDYAYDQGPNGAGRLTGLTHTYPAGHPFAGTLALGFAYDARGRLLSEARTLPNGQNAVLTYQYDAAGRLAQLTYPSGRQLAYQYDAAGRVSEVTTTSAGGAPQTIAAGIGYRPFGPAAAHTWGNGATHSRGFDAEGRPSAYPLGGSATLIGYDDASRILYQTDAANAALTTSYAYDAADRLTGQVEPATTRSWSYDAVGNRLAQTVGAATTAYQYGATSNRLTQAGSRTIDADAVGAITNDGINQYTYDARGRMIRSTSAAGTTDYLVDPLGRRLMKHGPLGSTAFLYDQTGHLVAELDAQGNAVQEHLWANDAPLAVAVAGSAGGGGGSEVILDNGSAAFTVTGAWPLSTAVAGYQGANYQTHAGADTPAGIVVDNGDAGFASTGTWTASTAVSGYQGTNYLHHTADADPVGSLIVDNAQGSASGAWNPSTAVPGYQGANYQTHPAGSGTDSFAWSATLAPGQYRVYAKWTAHANRATNAQYTVSHQGGQDTQTVDQRTNGGAWNLLGTYTFDTAGAVSLSDAGDGYLIADAVKFVPLTGTAPTATWTAALTPGSYQVYARWTAHANRATNAQYTITHQGGQDTLTVNQQTNGGAWSLLGTYSFGASGAVSASSAADGYVIADAVKFVPAGAGFDTAVWTPNLTGTYEVHAKWTAHPNRATNAQYTVAHQGGVSTVTVSQQANGGAWNPLGTYALTPQSAIALSSQANGYVIADAIRLVPTGSNQPAALHYVHTDHLGTPRAVVDQNNQTLWRWEGEAFGNAPANEDADGNAIPLAYNLRFPGQYLDKETNLHYNGARDYDPATGRYPTADPIGLAGGINPYLYANANPLMYADPDGLNPAGLIRVGLAAALAAARAAKAGIEKGYNACKNIRCKIAIHGPHHYFGWPFNQKMCHVQLNCWVKGVKGSKFVLRFPYSCDFPGTPAAGAGLLTPDEQDNGEGEE